MKITGHYFACMQTQTELYLIFLLTAFYIKILHFKLGVKSATFWG